MNDSLSKIAQNGHYQLFWHDRTIGTVRVTDYGPILRSIPNPILDTILDVNNRGNHIITESMHESPLEEIHALIP
jgi:hypothetical protein